MKSRVFFTAVLQEQVSESFIQHRRCLTRCFEQQTATIQPLKTCRREKTRTVELIIFVCCSFFVQTHLYKCSSLNIAKCMFMGVRRNFFRGAKVDILLIFFSLLAMQRKWTYTKNVQCYGNNYNHCFPYKKLLH